MKSLASSLAVAAILSSVPASSQVARRAQSNSRPIIEQIRPTDTHVILETGASPPSYVIPAPGESLIKSLTEEVDVVLIARIEAKRSELTEDGKWIRTKATARVEQALKSSGRGFAVGDRFVMTEESGTLQFGKTTVEAAVSWARPFQVRSRYLLFATLSPAGELRVSSLGAYEEEFGLLRRVLKSPDLNATDEIENLLMVQAADKILQHVATTGR